MKSGDVVFATMKLGDPAGIGCTCEPVIEKAKNKP